MADIYELCERVEKTLQDANVWADVYPAHGMKDICVEINHGDWKHDHLRTAWLLENMGAVHVSEKVTEEDGSDCYSAIHTFAFR